MRLAAGAWQHISQTIDVIASADQQMGTLKSNQYMELWHNTFKAAAAVVGLEQLPGHQSAEMLRSQHLPFICLGMVHAVYSMQLLQGWRFAQTATSPKASDNTRGSSSSSSSGGVGSGSSRTRGKKDAAGSGSSSTKAALTPAQLKALADPEKAWEFARSQHTRLPASHDKLLQLLGSNSKAVLWGAAVTAGHSVKPTTRHDNEKLLHLQRSVLHVITGLYWRHVSKWINSSMRSHGPNRRGTASTSSADCFPPRAWCAEVQLHFAMPTLMLHWVTNQLAAEATICLGPCVLFLSCATTKFVAVALAMQREAVTSSVAPASMLPADAQLTVTKDLLCLVDRIGDQVLRMDDNGRSISHEDPAALLAGILSHLHTICATPDDATSPPTVAESDSSPLPGADETEAASTATALQGAWAEHAVKLGRLLEAALRQLKTLHAPYLGSDAVTTVGASAEMLQTLCCKEVAERSPLLEAARAAGMGSREQLALFCITCTAMKMATAAPSPQADAACEGITQAIFDIMGVMEADQAAESPKSPVLIVPWLALLGRCFLYMSYRLKLSVSNKQYFGLAIDTMFIAWAGSWLRNDGVAPLGKHLAAAGYLVDSLQQLLRTASDAVHALMGHSDNTSAPARLLDVAQKLEAVGMALSNLPFPHACNNPSCTNLSGPSERALVAGRSTICSKDRTARYCSKACQVAHWPQHKRACKALSAAKATAAAPTVAAAVAEEETAAAATVTAALPQAEDVAAAASEDMGASCCMASTDGQETAAAAAAAAAAAVPVFQVWCTTEAGDAGAGSC